MRFRKVEGQVPSLREGGGSKLFHSQRLEHAPSVFHRGWGVVWGDVWEGLCLRDGSRMRPYQCRANDMQLCSPTAQPRKKPTHVFPHPKENDFMESYGANVDMLTP